MRIFVFAVGGTGARVLRSLAMLMASGINGMGNAEIVPIIVDCDKSNGDKLRTINCLNKYAEIHNTAKADTFFATPITPLRNVAIGGGHGIVRNLNDYELNFGPTTNGTFADNVGLQHMDGLYSETKELLNLLYDNSIDPNRAELELGLQMGFKGNPNIGSIVFNDLKGTPEFRHFERVCRPDDRIFIISSIFGGTGASGFPAIVHAIQMSDNPDVRAARKGALVMLPYFKVKHDPAKAIDSNTFNSKTKAALSYYEDSGLNRMINAIYYVADDNATSLSNEEGSTNQINAAHVAELVSALGIVDFCKKNDHDLLDVNKAFEFGIDSNSNSFDISGLYRPASDVWIMNLTQFAFSVKYYYDVIKGNRSPISNQIAYYNGIKGYLNDKFFKDLDAFIGLDGNMDQNIRWDYKKWLDELKNNTHAFNPFDKIASAKENILARLLTHKEISHRGVFRTTSYDIDDKKFAAAMDEVYHGDIQNEIKNCGGNHDVVYRNFLKMLYKTSDDIVSRFL